MCRIRCHFHFSLTQHVLQRWLRFVSQPCMFSEVTKMCVPIHWRVCFDGVKLKSRAKQYGNLGERSPSPTAQTRMVTFLPLCTAQSWSTPSEPPPGCGACGLKIQRCDSTYLPMNSLVRYAFLQTSLFKLLRMQRSQALPPFSLGFPWICSKWKLGWVKTLRNYTIKNVLKCLALINILK